MITPEQLRALNNNLRDIYDMLKNGGSNSLFILANELKRANDLKELELKMKYPEQFSEVNSRRR